MKVSLNWLTDYVDIALPADELAAALIRTGLSVDSIDETDTDIVLDVEVTSNRPDCLGHLGVAREIAAVTGAAFHPPQIGSLPTRGKAGELTKVDVLEPQLCPRYTARVVRGVKVGPSPRWLVERLEAVGLRGINNVVDVTNYVMMEYSQPLHSFDYDKLHENRIVVRRGVDGETMVSIDGTRCRLTSDMLIIADADHPVAIAGVMGGLDTEVAEGTVNVLIEAAQFDPLNVRRTSRKLALMSESNYRFERGVDPAGVDEASLRACQLIIQLAGGELAEGVVDVWARPHVNAVVRLRPARTQAVLGMEVPAERQFELLRDLHLSPKMDNGEIVCTIPSYRGDLTREIDLVEEIARLNGFERIPVDAQVRHRVVAAGLVETARRQVGAVLTAAGFDEALTFSFVDQEEAELLGVTETVRVDQLVRRTNNVLRPSVLPGLLRSCKANQDAGNADVSLFELASVLRACGDSSQPSEHVEIGMVSTRDFRLLRGAMETLVERLAAGSRLDVVEKPISGFVEGACGELIVDGEPAGVIGVIDRRTLDHYGLDKPLCGAALRFEALLSRAGRTRTYQPIGRFPAVRRDLSVIVDEDVTWRQILGCVESIAQPLRTQVNYVTAYRGKPVPDGRKSVTVELEYRSSEGTLRGEQVDEQVEQVLASLRESLQAELRK